MPSWKPRNFYVFITYDNVNPTSLRIPIDFTRENLKQILANNVQLTVSDGKSWPMSLTIFESGQLWLQKGWPEFAEYYHINVGHMLLFNHHGNSTFHVRIFNRSSCEINYFRLKKEHETEKEITQNVLQVMEAASQERSDTPFYSVTIRVTCFRSFGLRVPDRFCKRLLPNEEKSVDCVLRTSGRRKWGPVRCTNYVTGGRLSGTNWKKFSDDNHLKVGDVCVFKLVNETKKELKVTIIRAR